MNPRRINAQSMLVGPYGVDVIRNLLRFYTCYLDVGGTTYQVLTVGPAPNEIIVARTATPTGHDYWPMKVITDYIQDYEQLCIYCVEPASATALEFFPLEESR